MSVTIPNRFQEICQVPSLIREVLEYYIPRWNDSYRNRQKAAECLLFVFWKQVLYHSYSEKPFIEFLLTKVIPPHYHSQIDNGSDNPNPINPYLSFYTVAHKFSNRTFRWHCKIGPKLPARWNSKTYCESLGLEPWIDHNAIEIKLSATKITDEGLRLLAEGCPTIQRIYLGYTKITDKGLRWLANSCPDIQTIRLDKTLITDKGLRWLSEGCHKIQMIYLYDTKITDEGLRWLAKGCPKIQSISLDKTEITDIGFHWLAEGCPEVQMIYSYETNISDKSLAKTLWPYSIDISENGDILTYPPNGTLEV